MKVMQLTFLILTGLAAVLAQGDNSDSFDSSAYEMFSADSWSQTELPPAGYQDVYEPITKDFDSCCEETTAAPECPEPVCPPKKKQMKVKVNSQNKNANVNQVKVEGLDIAPQQEEEELAPQESEESEEPGPSGGPSGSPSGADGLPGVGTEVSAEGPRTEVIAPPGDLKKLRNTKRRRPAMKKSIQPLKALRAGKPSPLRAVLNPKARKPSNLRKRSAKKLVNKAGNKRAVKKLRNNKRQSKLTKTLNKRKAHRGNKLQRALRHRDEALAMQKELGVI